MSDFDLPDIQSTADLESLVSFSQEVGVAHLIYSVAKITRPRSGGLSPTMQKMKRIYEHLSQEQPLVFRGGSWRLPTDLADRMVIGPFLDLCRRHYIQVKMCKANLIATP